MIFVTVGTHEQSFNRLIECIDNLKKDSSIEEEVIIQTGFSTYEPQFCKWQKLFSYTEMVKKVAEAHIVITHGGPASFIAPLQLGKIPIVVPRKKCFGEHVNDHQVEFCNTVAKRQGNIIVVEELSSIKNLINDYDNIVANMPIKMKSNNAEFNRKFTEIVEALFEK